MEGARQPEPKGMNAPSGRSMDQGDRGKAGKERGRDNDKDRDSRGSGQRAD